MSAKLLHQGDPPPHDEHLLPDVPTSPGIDGRPRQRVNAVAECAICGRRFVSRHVDDNWSGGVYWVPLRWWHRNARRALDGSR